MAQLDELKFYYDFAYVKDLDLFGRIVSVDKNGVFEIESSDGLSKTFTTYVNGNYVNPLTTVSESISGRIILIEGDLLSLVNGRLMLVLDIDKDEQVVTTLSIFDSGCHFVEEQRSSLKGFCKFISDNEPYMINSYEINKDNLEKISEHHHKYCIDNGINKVLSIKDLEQILKLK